MGDHYSDIAYSDIDWKWLVLQIPNEWVISNKQGV